MHMHAMCMKTEKAFKQSKIAAGISTLTLSDLNSRSRHYTGPGLDISSSALLNGCTGHQQHWHLRSSWHKPLQTVVHSL